METTTTNGETKMRFMAQTFDGRLVFVYAATLRDAARKVEAKGYTVMKIRIASQLPR